MRKISHFIGVLSLMVLFMAACSAKKDYDKIDPELHRLDRCLGNTKLMDARKHELLDSLKQKLKATPTSDSLRRWKLSMVLGEEYRAFCSDSSAFYYDKAHRLAETNGWADKAFEARLRLAYAQSAAGLFTFAYNSLAAVDTANLTPRQMIGYAAVSRQLYSYMYEYSKGHTNSNDHRSIVQKGIAAEAYLISHLDEDSPERKFLYAQKLHRSGENAQAKSITAQLLKTLPEDTNLYGMTAYLMAQISATEGNDVEYGRYLALAAISDVKAGVKETMALPALAKWLYNKGEVDHAYRYINASLQDAMKSNARMRTVEIASLLPMVDEAYRKKISSSRDELMLYLALVVILFAIAGGLLFAVFKNMKRISAVNRKLAEQSKVQESYIGHFIGLCSSYSDKLESMRKLVNRKIVAGQTDELLKMLKSGKYTDPDTDDFFAVFDDTFLDLYPSFLDELNALLKPECRISHKKGTPLTTEIRIYAFVRLGVEESVKIAQILHCSVSTIYTYRNRMRGRAVNRDTFEKDVLNIGREDPE